MELEALCVEGLDDAGRVPPLWGLDHVGDGGGGGAALCLYFADGAEATGGERLLELAAGDEREKRERARTR